MTLRTLALLSTACLLNGAVVLDRVAVIVGRDVVKTSDIDRELRFTRFLNGERPDAGQDTPRKVADRLVDQELIRQEIMSGGYSQPTESDANALLQQIRKERFGGSEAQMRAALGRYGFNEDQLRAHLLWQLTVLRFIDQRFRAGVLVTDEEVTAYYNDHRGELEKKYPRENSRDALEPKIREIITGERVNQAFEEWLNQARRRTRVQFREVAFK